MTKVIYLMTNTEKNTMINLPTKCPVCHLSKEPNLISFIYNENNDMKIKFKCVSNKCSSSFSAFYIKGRDGKKQYHFLSFI